MDEDREKPRATVGGLKELKRRREGQREGSSEIKRRWRTPGVEIGPTARFAAVLRPWRARRGKGCARSSEIKFFLSLRTIERVRGERERERSQRPKLESELISWHAVHLVVYSSPALSSSLSLSLPLQPSSLPRLSPFPCPPIPECGRTGAQMGYWYHESTDFKILGFPGSPLCKIKTE